MPPHQELRCLQSLLFSALVLKELKQFSLHEPKALCKLIE